MPRRLRMVKPPVEPPPEERSNVVAHPALELTLLDPKLQDLVNAEKQGARVKSVDSPEYKKEEELIDAVWEELKNASKKPKDK